MTSKTTPGEKPIKSQTLVRGLDIVESVMESPKSISEIASQTSMTYSTAHRIISVLVERGYLRQVPDNKLTLGAKVIEAGFLAHRQIELVKVARPHLENLAAATSDTVHLARLEGQHVIYLEKIPSRRPVEIRSRIGGLMPVVTTGVGKALVLDWTKDQLDAMALKGRDSLMPPQTPAEWVQQVLGFSREQYAFDLGDSEPELRCVAVPVRDASTQIVAAISVTSTVQYMPPDRMQELIPLVQATACAISAELGLRSK
nr:IclR family transcriptional regulator [uncultured Sulfitobacter sp.]